MKKILKISLFIAALCLLLLILSNSNVQATDVTVTTVKELQEVMGATEYSTINGTTLTITKDFTWDTKKDYIDVKIPELTIDFNGKRINVKGQVIRIAEGKVILKDSQGGTGGFHCSDDNAGWLIHVGSGTELIIENGQYTTKEGGLISNEGGNVTVKNGVFNAAGTLLNIIDGKVTIDNGKFEAFVVANVETGVLERTRELRTRDRWRNI